MRKMLKIAKLEISLLFYSPIAWLILIVFTIQSGLSFVDLIDARETSQQLGTNLSNLTQGIFTGNGFLTNIKNKLYLYIPLLTMGLMSRELSSGSIKLLYSSPLTPIQIIFGKYLAMIYYGLLLCVVLIIITVCAYFSIENLDVELIVGGIFGLFLLLCAYSAIGLFMSSLTTYQVVAAISTLAVLAALNFVGKLGQSIEFVREITYWISISGRTSNFINGIISTKDIVYFLLVIGFFLTLTILRLQKGRVSNSNTQRYVKYVSLIILVLGLGYISSRPTLNRYYDTTRFKENTLTDNTKDLLSKLEEPVRLTAYINVLNGFSHLGAPKWRIFERSQFDKYTRYLPELEMDYVVYYDSTYTSRDERKGGLEKWGHKSALAHGYDPTEILRPEEIRSKINLKPEGNIFVRKLEYKNKSTSLRMFFDMVGYPQEAEVSAAVKRILEGPARIGFLKGQNERNVNKEGDRDYKKIFNTLNSRSSLINQGFDIIPVTADSLDYHSFTVLVIADPMNEIPEQDQSLIRGYIQAGGNLIINVEQANRENLEPILDYLGVKLSEDILLQNSSELEPELIQAEIVNSETTKDKFSSTDIVSLPGALALTYNDSLDFKHRPLLQVRNAQIRGAGKGENDSIDDDLEPKAGVNGKEVFELGSILTRDINGKHQKIVVFGDADIFSNGELSRFNLRNENASFTTELFSWMTDFKYPIDTVRPDPVDNAILVSQKEIAWLKLVLIGVLPTILLLWGGVILIKRKRN